MDKHALCDVCRQKLPKYKCPGCAKRSCSLECVKRHKVECGCSGKRCKTMFVKMSDFGDNQLYSDYYFLEDVSRYIDSTRRERIQNNKEHRDSQRIAHQMHWLRIYAGRHLINFQSQPPGMSKHRINHSRTVRSKDGSWSIRWTVRLVFKSTDVDHIKHNVTEGIILSDLLDQFFHPTLSDPIMRHRLRKYVQESSDENLQVFLENESSSSNVLLDLNKTLKENLQGKTIVEFPVLIVASKTDCIRLEPMSTPERLLADINSETLPVDDNQIADVTTPTSVEVCSDWSDYEDGEVRGEVSSLQLIAQEYGDD